MTKETEIHPQRLHTKSHEVQDLGKKQSFEKILGQIQLMILESLPERQEETRAPSGERGTGGSHLGELFLPQKQWRICHAGDPGSIPGSGRSPGEGNGNSLQYPCLENPPDGGARLTTVHGVAESQTQVSN